MRPTLVFASVLAGACADVLACEPKPPDGARAPAPAVLLTVAPATSAAAPAAPASAPPTPSRFELMTESASNRGWSLTRVAGGVALLEHRDAEWHVRIARGRGGFAPVDAVDSLPETKKPWRGVVVGEIPNGELWLTATELDVSRAHTVTLRVAGKAVTRMPNTWVTSLLPAPGGGAFALPSKVQGYDMRTPQTFQSFGGATAKPPAIPPDLRLYDTDIRADGEIHAVARRAGSTRDVVGFIAPRAGPSRTFALPRPGDYEADPELVHGSASFLANTQFGQVFVVERDGRAVPVRATSALVKPVAAPNGDIYYVRFPENRAEQVGRTRIDPDSNAQAEQPALELPDPAALAAAGARACTRIHSIDQIVVGPDGTLWVAVFCVNDARAVLRSAPP